MGLLRLVWRTWALVWHLLKGVIQVIYQNLRNGEGWHQSAHGQSTISGWMARLAQVLGLQVNVKSPPLPVPAMIVANHISWLDAVAIASVRPAVFLAKDNVRRWPLVGALAASSGTQFIRRHSNSALRDSNNRLCHALRLQQHVALFPEGTTTSGEDVGVFHSALFTATQQAYCPVQPLAIRYRQNGQRDVVAPYVGNDLFVIHLLKILWRKQTCVELQFLPPISSREHRRTLAKRSREMIMAALEKDDCIPAPMPVLQPLLHCQAIAK